MKFAVFASGNGSNFQALVETLKENYSVEFSFLFSDNKDAYVLERAEQLGIKPITMNPKNFENKTLYEEYLTKLCIEYDVDYILLAGYMRIVGETLLGAFPNRIVNIHPSLLPDFKGAHAIEDAFNAGVEKTGVTVHFVDNGVDTGPIIDQWEIDILSEDTLKSLEEKIHQIEHKIYPKVVKELAEQEE